MHLNRCPRKRRSSPLFWSSTRYGIQVHRDSVDLCCRDCGGKLRLPAATDEDLDRLCCQMSLTIPGRA